MDAATQRSLAILAAKIRKAVIEGTYHAKSGHPGGSLSIADLLTYLYWKEMNIDPANPQWADRDRLVLSKGHAAPALYGALAHRGYFSTDLIPTLRKPDSILQGHPDMKNIPGVDMSSGSLGQGISAAVGMALAAKLDNTTARVYAILGDGEIEEGQVWEAAMFASAKHLTNLVAIVDNNNLQIDGSIDTVNSPYPIDEKFAAFGWYVIKTNAHDFNALEAAFAEARSIEDKPVAIIQQSVKGKGISFMENQCGWHGKATNADEYAAAMAELDATLAELEG